LPRLRNSRIRLVAALAIGVAITMLLVKFFTAEVSYVDDPTVELVVRRRPSFNNELVVNDERDLSGVHVVLRDENAFVGEAVYRAVTSTGWVVGCFGAIAATAYLVATRDRRI